MLGSVVGEQPPQPLPVPGTSHFLEGLLHPHDYIFRFHYHHIDLNHPRPTCPAFLLSRAEGANGQLYSSIQMGREEFDARPWVTAYVSEEEVLEIKMAFDLFDLDHGGSIDPKELKEAIHSLGIEAKAAAVYQMIAELDKDGSGQIEFDEFYEMMTHKPNEQESREEIHKIFIMFDIHKTGFIGLKELRKVSKELGQLADDFFLQEMIQRADLDGDDLVSEEEFYSLMTKKAH